MPNNLKSRFKALNLSEKIVLLGSGLTFFSVFLPWYSDIDRFNIGDTFLGITGPLYLAGLIVLAAASMSFGSTCWKLMGKKLPKTPISKSDLHLLGSGFSVLMLILATSVFFHSKFGLNLTDKSMGVGLVTAYIGSGLTSLGALLMRRDKEIDLDDHLEPLIDLSQDRERGKVQSEVPETEEVMHEQDPDSLDREQTVEQAMKSGRIEVPDAPTKAWNQVQESMNSMRYDSRAENTNDIR